MDEVFKKRVIAKTIPVFVWSLCILSTVYSIGLSMSVSANIWHDENSKEQAYYWNRMEYKWYKLLNTDAQENKGVNIIIASYDKKYINGPPGYSNSVCITQKYDSLIDGNFHHSKPVIIYALIPDSLNPRERNFISMHEAKPVLKSDKGEVYRTFLH